MQASGHRKNVEKQAKSVFITDLDHSDVDSLANGHRKAHKKRTTERITKDLQTMTGSYHRSRSAECHVRQAKLVSHENGKSRSSKIQNNFNELLKSKEKEMEKMFQRIVTLQQFNEQFSEENTHLQEKIQHLEVKIEKLHSQIENCAGCKNLTETVEELTEKNKKINTDLEMMKTLVYRLNVQIEYYQDKQRHSEDGATENQGGGDRETPASRVEPWQHAAPLYTQTLGPLLKSYDEMIRDKEELFQQYKTEFEHFSNELKRVLEENNTLMQQHEQLKREVGSWREERTRYNAALSVCRQRAETHAQMSDLTKEKLVEVVQAYEHKVQSLMLEVEHTQSAFIRCKSELTNMKTINALPKDSIASSLEQCKELLERLKSEHNDEKQKMQEKIEELTQRNVFNDGEIKILRQENSKNHKELAKAQFSMEDMRDKYEQLKTTLENVSRSRAGLKARLRIALQWAEKLEKGQTDIKGTWDALKRLETIVKHKESQVRGLHAGHMEEMDKLQNKLRVKDETIRSILKSKVTPTNLPHKLVEHNEDFS